MLLLSKIEIYIGSGNNSKSLDGFEYVSIDESIYGVDSFEITCRYDAIEKLDGFLIENAQNFLGLPISIQTTVMKGDKELDGLVFQGYITDIQGSRSGMSDNDKIIISGGSKEILLDGRPTNKVFMDKTLKEIVNEVLKNYNFKNKVSPRDNFRYPYIVQYEENDLVFLKRLSIRYGEWFFLKGNEIIFGELPVTEKSLTIGTDLKNFRYQLRIKPLKFTLLSVDPIKPSLYKFKSGSSIAELNPYGKHALVESKTFFNTEGIDYYEHLNVNESDFKKALDKVGERNELSDAINLSDLSGSSTNPFLTVGLNVNVKCIVEKQNVTQKIGYGKYLITSVRHNFDHQLSYDNSFTAIPANASLPEITDPTFFRTTHYQMGKIVDNLDPKKLGRVRINFCWMENDSIMTPWAKVITPYSQANSGFYFVPAVNSRVMVGFEDGDVEKPYCLGTLFDENHSPDSAWTGDYNNKDAKVHAIRTASGQTIELHDESGKEKIRIYDTKNKNEITLDSANGEIIIKSNEKLTIEAKDIAIKAQNGIKIEAGQGLDYKANEIKSEAQTSLELKATMVEIKANGSLKAEGSASAEVSSSGVMTVKGSMVMIN
jgi:hypothetical protein